MFEGNLVLQYSKMNDTRLKFMELALQEAKKAGQIGEVPVGAVLVSENGEILSAAHNLTIKLVDPTAHAEILAIREAALNINNYRLLNTTLYVTVEPCIMCMGAIVHARIHGLFLVRLIPNGERQDRCITTRRMIG